MEDNKKYIYYINETMGPMIMCRFVSIEKVNNIVYLVYFEMLDGGYREPYIMKGILKDNWMIFDELAGLTWVDEEDDEDNEEDLYENAKDLDTETLEEIKSFYISYISKLKFKDTFKKMKTLKSYNFVYDSNFSCIVVYDKGELSQMSKYTNMQLNTDYDFEKVDFSKLYI